jgi:murein DD-endopeptidase MepM/ murein hydrolase activator NlpD
MKSKYFLRVFSLLVLLVSLIPVSNASALPAADPPPADMFQLPWDLGIAWVAIDGLDNGTRRPLSSSHNFSVGGAIDFAPHNNMRIGENTSNFWVTAAAAGTVIAKSFCHVKIDHANGWTTEYQFLGNIQVKTGDSVSRNQRLGVIADGIRQRFCPGSSEPNVPHLHFMLRPSLRNATLAGWEINYLPILSKTTFRKNGQTLGLLSLFSIRLTRLKLYCAVRSLGILSIQELSIPFVMKDGH